MISLRKRDIKKALKAGAKVGGDRVYDACIASEMFWYVRNDTAY